MVSVRASGQKGLGKGLQELIRVSIRLKGLIRVYKGVQWFI